MRSPRTRAISSTQRSTAESIPRPSRSIFRKPASAQESLSHWTICLPSIAAGTTGQQSISGLVAIDHPARVLGEVPGQPVGLLDQAGQPAPALSSPIADARSPDAAMRVRVAVAP